MQALACPLCLPGTVSKGNGNVECEICEANTYSLFGEVLLLLLYYPEPRVK